MYSGILIVIILICVFGEGFFSGSEIALFSADRLRLRHEAKLGNVPARQVLEALRNPEWILGTTLFGTNFCMVLGSTLATLLFYSLFDAKGVPLAIALMALINWIFAEIVPKSIFQHYNNQLAIRVYPVLKFFAWLFYPVVWIFSRVASLIVTSLSGKPASDLPFINREEIQLLMRVISERSDIKPAERKMIDRLLDFKAQRVDEVMIPLINVSALNVRDKVRDAVALIAQTKHRRFPIYHQRIDRIIGILNSFDILGENGNASLKKFYRSALFVPPNMKIALLFEQLRSSGQNMAIVVDEYGGAEGIVTVEDILEEVVGELEDEYDREPLRDRITTDGSIITNGRTEISELRERFGIELPDGDYDTIGGYIIDRLQYLPRAGEKLRYQDWLLTVRKASRRVIQEVLIERTPRESEEAGENGITSDT